MPYKETKKFTIKEIEKVGGKKIIKAINKRGIGDIKIVVPLESDLEEQDELDVIIKESRKDEEKGSQ
ncbi:hypothetical protein C9439_07040 [archaeon SCG-AAA382B04]|nr:hypothetical protein C9439_07040 [archaeon SCG-AAA382B04]